MSALREHGWDGGTVEPRPTCNTFCVEGETLCPADAGLARHGWGRPLTELFDRRPIEAQRGVRIRRERTGFAAAEIRVEHEAARV